MRYDDDRRLKIAYVDYSALLWYFRLNDSLRQAEEGKYTCMSVPELDLPDGAQIVSVYNDDARRGLVVVLHSADFDVVPRGELLPHIGGLDIKHQVIKIQVAKEA